MNDDPLIGTRNFSAGEYERQSSGGRVPDEFRANAQRTLELLQRVRDALGVAVVITDGYRTPEDNAATAGSSQTSPHMTALGADFDVPSLTKREVGRRLDAATAAGEIAPYDQLIYYLTDGHYHVTTPAEGVGGRAQQLLKVTATKYEFYTGADSLPDTYGPRGGASVWALVAVALVGVVLLVLLSS